MGSYKLNRLNKCARRTATGVNQPFVGLDHLNLKPNDAAWCVELAAFLPLGGELGEVFIQVVLVGNGNCLILCQYPLPHV